MNEKIYHYPVWIRFWHWFNALFCLGLIITGISMQYADPESPFINFESAVKIHNVCGILLTFNYLLFFTGNFFSINGNHYNLRKGIFNRMVKQFRYYALGIFKGEKAPFPVNVTTKFNPLQKFVYTLIMYVGVPVIILSGWALLFPEIIINQIFGVSGVFLTDIVHVYFCTLGLKVGSLFMSMINGWVKSH